VRAGGQLFPAAQLDQIVADLDEHYLLANERAALRRAELESHFEQLMFRPAALAGSAYPAEPETCRLMWAELSTGLTHDGRTEHPRGLILPHIDLRIGRSPDGAHAGDDECGGTAGSFTSSSAWRTIRRATYSR